MDRSTFDTINKTFTNRRLSRRRALAEGGVGLTAAAMLTCDSSALGFTCPARTTSGEMS